jgi:hypothetical protein
MGCEGWMLKVRSSSLCRLLIGLSIGVLLAGRPAVTTAETPEPSVPYAADRIIVLFRSAPTESDLEAFEARHFLSLVDYIGLDYPEGAGWYVFHIEDRMDAGLVRGLLHGDPVVCLAELIPQGERHATTGLPPGQEDAPDCVPLASPPPTLVPLPTGLDAPLQGEFSGASTGGSGSYAPTLGWLAIAAAGAVVVGVALLRALRPSQQSTKLSRRQRRI